MLGSEYLLAGSLAMIAGIDRIAFGQFMISRPLVIGPLTGLVFGNAMIGLK